ncbi:MAG: hypothetical protein JST39_07880, partial [Bacteroidetes bacterium]|nr:hypothetical protein [Bacteroidota bacterium]
LVFELEKKSQKDAGPGVQRTLSRMQQVLEEAGLLILNPLGEAFSDTRTDVEATLTGSIHGKMKITEVLKPIVYMEQEGKKMLVQRGVVLAG